MTQELNYYTYPILTKSAQEAAHQPYVHPDAAPLYATLNEEIAKHGSRKLAVEWLLLESQEIFGFRETEIKTRIRNYQHAINKRSTIKSPFLWSPHEVKILLENKNKTARQISQILNRTIWAILFKRQKINKSFFSTPL